MDRQTKTALIKAVCAVTSDSATLAIAKWWEMTPNGRAAAHLDQYLEGKGDLRVDLARLLQEDQGVQTKVHTEIIFALREGKAQGTVAVPQGVYSNKDWQYAIGSMNVNWTFPSSLGSDKAHVGFRNEYRWHPNEPRISQCVHQAADRLRVGKARNYWQEGSAEVVIWLPRFGASPSRFHVVRAGDTLSKIAQQYYGNSNRWPDIHAANKQRVPDANRLTIGTILEVPSAR